MKTRLLDFIVCPACHGRLVLEPCARTAPDGEVIEGILHVIQADIYQSPFRTAGDRPFDFIYSIGVLHHLPDPLGGFISLVRLLKPGGTIFGWFYGHENNAVVHYGINPFRKYLTAKLPPPVLRVLSWPLAVPMRGLVKGVYRPLAGTSVFRVLPSHDYLYILSAFRFNHNYSIVFDHLVTPTAFYIKREDVASWFADAGLEDVEISWRNQNSWRGRGRRPSFGDREGAAELRVSVDAS